MPLPYLFSILLYVSVAVLSAADAALVSLNIVPSFLALTWVRVHFITLGIISQAIFGLLPGLAASLSNRARPSMRWDIWLSLNAGLVTLVAGFAGMILPMILAGGTLIFVAASLLLVHIWKVRAGQPPPSLKFYIVGVFYLLVGILIGTGLFLGWSQPLHIQVPLEAHIHANSWGFISLVFAGLLIDFLPMLGGQPLGSKQDLGIIFWGMTLGAFGLVLGPWLGRNLPLLVSGLVLHLAATLWLLVLAARSLRNSGRLGSAGGWHLLASYTWILAPVLAAPLTLLKIIDGAPIEATAPQALIYGWVLPFGIALIPFSVRRIFLKDGQARLGGSWWSLAATMIGSLLVWLSIFLLPVRGLLHGTGFALYALAVLILLLELIQIARQGLQRIEPA